MIRFEDVSYRYPFQEEDAVSHISLEVREGEAVLLTGASGCGKSTMARMVNGLIPHYFQGTLSGKISIMGKYTASHEIEEISHEVGTLFQNPEEQFFTLRVRDELSFSLECRGRPPQEITNTVVHMADRFKLWKIMDSSIFDLSEGEKQKVALACIIAARPRILVLDEPSANLDPGATDELARLLLELKREGMTILIADHRLYWLSELIDSVCVLDKGNIVKSGDFSILQDDAFRNTCGLRKPTRPEPVKPLIPNRSATGYGIRVEDLRFAYKNKPPLFNDLSLEIQAGHVIAVVGENGAGKTTFARMLTGLQKSSAGKMYLHDKPIRAKKMLAHSGIVLQNADHQLNMNTVRSELRSALKNDASAEQEARINKTLQRFGLARFDGRHPQSLSGGQKQRLVIACGLVRHPDILILDEPTSGLDGINMRIIAEILKDFALEGACVLVITHDLELIELACDRQLRLPFDTPNEIGSETDNPNKESNECDTPQKNRF